jgi:large subunit ribosomal protein L3
VIRYAFQKVGMTHSFEATGEANGVTVLKLFPSTIKRHETLNDGRKQIIVEFDTGHAKKISKGFIIDSFDSFAIGSSLPSPALTKGNKVSVTGTSKGKGFQDVMTRYNFGGGPASHGSRFHRAPGSVGMRTEPGRTPKGKKMPGRHGNKQCTVRNMEIVYWSPEESILAIAGGVPGATGGMLFI